MDLIANDNDTQKDFNDLGQFSLLKKRSARHSFEWRALFPAGTVGSIADQ
ncbi:hypothetical protein KZO25_18700 [Halomonas sp. ANAO-440]|nr:hypothetical protein [Halomonas sp. ANAO-440]MBZ0332342.1 hypothetical protein [Halomonas sp. ANAO-440]